MFHSATLGDRPLNDPARIVHTVACRTEQGRTHRKNQDTGGAWSWLRPDGTPVSLAIVADGVSAGSHSEEASRLAVDLIHRRVSERASDPTVALGDLVELLAEAARGASTEIAASSAGSAETANATTLAAAVSIGTGAGIAWCGDSRVYRIDTGSATQLTRDHSWMEGIVSLGLMSAQAAAMDPRAHMITGWLGPQDGIPEVDTVQLEVTPGDVILCCSDGLYLYLEPPEGRQEDFYLPLRAGLNTGIEKLVETAVHRGGHDDITVAAIQIERAS